MQTVIVGAGVTGLIAAIELSKAGKDFVVLEKSDRAGGRVKTDSVKGFLLDHGFQVLLTNYPLAQEYLNYSELNLKSFLPGATIFEKGRIHSIYDPMRYFSGLLSTLFSPHATLSDKLKVWQLKREVCKKSDDEIFAQSATSTLEYLKKKGFSNKIIQLFFKPFYSGIFLETELQTSSNMFEFVFKQFSLGKAALPANGIEQIVRQLEAQIPTGKIRLNTAVKAIHGNSVELESGETIEFSNLILAVEGASSLLGSTQKTNHQTAKTIYFESRYPLLKQPIIGLFPNPESVVNNICNLKMLSSNYAPTNKHLISVSVVQQTQLTDKELVQKIKRELTDYFGIAAKELEWLATYNIPYALPNQNSVQNKASIQVNGAVITAGDHLLYGSLNAAMQSGKAAAQYVIEQ